MTERAFVIRDDVIRSRFMAYLSRLDLAKPWEVVLRPFIGKRTNEQNARYWLLTSRVAQETGHSAEELHELALHRFFGTKEIHVGDTTIKVPMKRSSTRNKKEFAVFMEATEAFYASELGIWLE